MHDDSLGLADLEDLILASTLRVAPEQEASLVALFSQEGITIRFDRQAHDLLVGVSLATNEVVLGTRCLARLWGHVYAYCSLYKTCVQESDQQEFHALPTGFQAGRNLLEWALRDQLAANLRQPPVAPSPSAPRPADRSGTNLERIVTEVFLVTCGYLIHHEISHVRLGHARSKADPRDNEFEADEGAAKWILAHATGEWVLKKRYLGIACALLWLYSLQVHQLSEPASSTHPPAALRLQAIMFPRLSDPTDVIWDFLTATMAYHLQAVGYEYQPAQFAVGRDAVRQFISDGMAAGRGAPQPVARA